nr:Ig-like domain-containing protein [Winslowiella iniecta]
MPDASLDIPFTDGILNGDESQSDQTLSGNTGVTGPGQSVIVTVGGNDYPALVNSDGSWSVLIPSDVLQALPDGSSNIVVVVSDAAGNTSTSTTPVTVDTLAPGLSIEPISDDGLINASEQNQPLTIEGSAEAGATVTITLNGIDYPATVDNNGDWRVNIPAAVLQGLDDGDYAVTATATDVAGNSTTQTSSVTLITADPTFTLAPVAGDGILNSVEQGQPLTLNGTGTPGDSVSVMLNGKNYTATVAGNGAWSLVVPTGDLAALADGSSYTVAVTVTDAAGNTATQQSALAVDTTAPNFTLNPVAGDGILNASEQSEPLLISGSGTTGDSITVTLNGKEYAATVGANGQWSVQIPPDDLAALNDGDYTLSVGVSDAAGNTSTQTTLLTVDTAGPLLTVDPIAEDGVVNATEQGQPLAIGGTASAGDTITVTLNGQEYTTTVGSNGEWSVNIPASALLALDDGDYPFTVTASNASGNSTTETSTLSVDTAAPALSVEPISGDGYLNSAEQGETLMINGSGDAGDSITVTLDGVDYPALVGSNGQWSVDIPPTALAGLADGDYTVSVTVIDTVGNTTTVTRPLTVAADPANQPTISVDLFTGDGELNGAEQGEDQRLTGTTSNVQAGQTVIVTLNGVEFTGLVQSGGGWSVLIPSSAFTGLQNSTQTFTVTVSDAAGNTASASEQFTVDNSFSALAIGIISGDDYLNATEAQSDLTISGSSNNVAAGSIVTVTFNGVEYSATVGADGKWSANIPAAALASLPDGQQVITATTTDINGNTLSSETTLNVLINDLPQPTLDTPFGDGVLSGDEADNPQTLTGSTGVAGNGQSVTVNVGGVDYPATVDGDGNWTVTVPSAALQNLPDGSSNVVVTVSDIAGNSSNLITPVTIDTTPPDIMINPISGDGLINASEQNQPLTVSGTAEAGSTVIITLNGVDYPATVAANGSWSATLPATALQALGDGVYDISVTATDANGNSDTALSPFTLDTSAPAFTLGTLAGDGILNASEQQQPLAINGSGTAGDSVSVTLNGTVYSTIVGPNGQWSVSVPADDLATLTDGSYPLSVTVSDAAGNSTTQQSSLAVDISPPALAFNTPSGDGILNSAEQGQPLLLSGSGSAGDNVTVTLNGKTYQATVGVNGNWSLEVPAADLAALDEGANPLSVTARDAAGNTTTLQSNLTLDSGQPTLTVAVDIFAGNGIVDDAESRVDQLLTGTTTNVEAGQIVTVTLAGVSYSGVVQSSGAWNVTIPAGAMAGLSDGSQNLTVSVSNVAGNSVVVNGNYTINTSGSSLAIEPISGDGYLNASEQLAALEIAGQTSNVLPGTLVQVTVNGVSYNATVSADGSWTAIVPAGALAGVVDGPLNISATVNDAAGNPLTATSMLNVLANPQLAVSIDPPFGDGSLNTEDVENNGILTGSTGVSGDGQTVSVSFGGNDYTGTVASDGSWSVTIPAPVLETLPQGNTPFVVTVGDIAGNTANGSDSVLVDTLPPLLQVNTLSGDGVLNASEQGQPLPVSGTGEAGAEITVSLNGTDYTTNVAANGSWTLTIPAADLGELVDGDYNLTVIATDAAGNSTQQNSPLTVKADADNLPVISIDTFAGNNIVDGAEQQTAQTLSGVATNVEAGQTVTITLDGQIYTAQVQPSGAWSVLIPSAALQALANGTASFTVAVSDIAGNTASNSLDIEVNSAASGLAVDTLSDDGYLNAAEAAEDLLISGTSENVPQGSTVTINFNNQTFTAEIGANGVWSVLIPPASLAGLPDGPAIINVSAVDAAGNAVSSTATLNVLVNQLPDATIQPPFGDGVLNAAEAGSDQPLRGSTGISGDGQTVSVTIDGNSYSGTVDGDGNWTVNLPTAVLQALAEGDSSAQVTVTDAAGNSSTIDAPFSVDREAPVLIIDTIAGDDRVNALESVAAISVSGSTSAEEGQVVTITLNGQTYNAIVDASGDWSVDLPAGALAGIANGSYTLTATVSDAAGNPVTTTSEIEVETAPLVPTLDTPFTDGYLNIDEAETVQTLTGTTGATGDGQSVVVSLDGNDYTATVDADGNWSLELDAGTLQGLASGNLPIVVTVTDNAGNQGVANSNVSVDFDAPTLDINDIAGDNIINAAEALQVVAVSGTASLSEAGQQITVLFNGQSYQTLVQNNGNWSVNLPVSALQGLADGDYPVSVSLTDVAGNTTTVEQTLTVDASVANLPTLSINAVSDDDYINQAESGEALEISGTSSNLEAGRTVSIVLNGQTYSATVDADGNWSATVPAAEVGALADGVQTITASASDSSGNPASNTHTVTVIADAGSQPLLTINPVSGNDIVNAQEANSPLVISGSSQRIPDGGTIVVTLNGNTYNATVDANGSWTTTIPAIDVQDLDQGSNTVTATGQDIAGNSADASHDFIVDSEAPLLDIALDVGLDGILNLAEALAGLLVNGSTEAGLTVTVTLNNTQYSAIADLNGDWSLNIPAGDLLLLNDGTLEVGVSVTDSAGNTTTELVELDVAINALPLLTINTPFIDGLLNASEAAVGQVLSGTATNLAAGTVLEISVGGLTFDGLVDADGNWSATLPAGALQGLLDGQLQLEVSALDAAGNPAAVTTTVDLLINNLPLATILPPFVDGALNAVEAGLNQTINGTTGITGPGQIVTLNIDGDLFNTTVDTNGNWSATLTPAQLADLGNGNHIIEVVVTDRAGNSNEATLDFNAIITGLPQPVLMTPFVDGILNAAEAAIGGTLDGSSGITGEQTVIVNINGSAFQASVDEATGVWSLDLPASLLQALPDGNWPISVSVTDSVGNVGSVSDTVLVAINNLPQPTLNLPFGDGALNIAEAAAGQLLSGKTGITGIDQNVTVEISGFNGDNPLLATVDINGNWSLNLTPIQLATLADGPHTLTVTATDVALNSATISQQVISALTLPDPMIDVPFIDGILNIAEAGTSLTLTGSTGVEGLNQGVQLKIDVNGLTYTGIVDADGNWAVDIPAGALSGLTDGTHSINVTVTDGAGNSNTQSLDFTAALTLPLPTLALPFDDGFLNAAELMAGGTLTGTTGVTGAGQQVTVTLAGINYDATVDNAGNWTLDLASEVLDGLAQGNTNLAVEVTDIAGNSANITSSFVVDTLAPAISITPFTGDNTLTYLESLTTQTLSGTTSGATTGSIVTVSMGTATLTGVVQANGNWTVNVTPVAMEQLGTTSGVIGVTVSDAAGNIGNASITVAVNLTPPPVALVTLTPVNGDNIINAADGVGAVTLNGTYANLGLLGGTVSVTVNGIPVGTMPVIGDDGNWSISVPNGIFIDGNATVAVTAIGIGGTASTTSTVLVDRGIPTLTINAFATDDVLNGSETAVSQAISGSASLSETGRTVNVILNGKNYSAVVQANGNWSALVPVADLQALGQGVQTISASLSDAAGNTGTATHLIEVDTVAPLLQIDALLGDNILNALDILLTQTLTGRAPGAEGETIGLYLGDGNPLATGIVNPDGTFSLDLTPEVLGSLTEGPLVFGVRVSDEAGNRTEATLTVNKVVNSALNLVVDSVFGDGFLNAADTLIGQTISGVATSAGMGAIVELTLGGTTLSAAVGQDGKWAIVVPPNLLQLLGDGDIDLDLTLTDAAGNSRTVTETVTAIVNNLPVIGDLTGLFGGDNLLNVVESTLEQTIGGVINAASGSVVTVTLGSKSYQSTVNALGEWGVTIPPLDLGALLDGTLSLGVSVVDPAGNTAASSVDVGIFNTQPSISLSPIFGDGILNVIDLLTGQTISGVVNNVAAGSIVTLSIGSSTVTATVGQNGAFSASVAPNILGTLLDGNLTVGASVTDVAGNTASTSAGLLVDVTAPTVTLTPLFGDGLLNAADALLTQLIGGTVNGAEPGSKVVVNIAGQEFVTSTAANGSFGISLSPAILQGLLDGNLTVGVTVTDSAGNTGGASASALVGIHNLPVITLNPLFGDGVLNLLESLVTQTISGTIANVTAGSTVRVNIGNSTVTATVGNNGQFSAQVTPDILGTLLNGNLTVGVSVTDVVGNTTSVSAGVQVGISNPPTLTLNSVFGDGVLSAADLVSAQTISGSSTNLATGSTVNVTLAGHSYSTQVTSNGNWTLSVPKTDLATLANGTLTVSASATDAYGNVASKTGAVSVIANTPPTVSVSTVFGDGLLNAADALSAQTITGTSTNAEGSTISVSVGNQNFTGIVGASGSWSVSVPSASLLALADGTQTVTASVTNAAGNSGSGTGSAIVGTHTLPGVAIGSIFGGDGYLNLAEASTSESISGTSTNAVGSQVSVDVAGTVYTTTVAANGSWSVNVPSSVLRSIADGSHTIMVTLTDTVGNTAVAGNSFTAKTHALPVIGVDPVLSLLSVLITGLTISGGTLNLAQGTRLNVTLNGSTLQATTDALGRYSVKFPGGLLTALSLSSIVTVTAVDVAGNPAATSNTLLLGSLLPVAAVASESASLFAMDMDDARQADTHSLAVTHDEKASEEIGTATAASSATSAADITTTGSAVAEEGSYTIGGVVITRADGSTQQGASVTGSAGDDTVVVTDLNFDHIDGGQGIDTLVLNGEHLDLDLSTLGLKIGNIEVLDLGQSGTNSVRLDLQQALALTDSPQDDLLIKGADGSQVTLSNTDGGVWATVGQRTVDGQIFDVYHNSALVSDNNLGDVLVQHNLQVHVV